MNKFYNLSTEKYVPLSHDNSFLFNHYDRIQNFLKQRIDSKFKNILAKPIKNNYDIDWFSVYADLENDNNDVYAKQLYWEFQNSLKQIVEQLSLIDENSRNWAELLNKVFRPEDNIIFNNGKDICIIWGWKFENNTIHKAVISEEEKKEKITSNDSNISLSETSEVKEDSKQDKIIDEPVDEVIEDIEDILEDEITEEKITKDEIYIEDIPEPERKSFLEFLKEFAGYYWWILFVLLCLICLVFLYKTLLFS